MVLICISLMVSGVRHLFMYLLAICLSSSAHFNWIFVFGRDDGVFDVELYEFFIDLGY